MYMKLFWEVDYKMATIYASLIRKGLKTIDQVPEQLRAEVERILGTNVI